MMHATRCPNCHTAFRLTIEQLSAMKGKVRCGRCALVFNATEHLLPSPPAAAHKAPPPVAPPAVAEIAPAPRQAEDTAESPSAAEAVHPAAIQSVEAIAVTAEIEAEVEAEVEAEITAEVETARPEIAAPTPPAIQTLDYAALLDHSAPSRWRWPLRLLSLLLILTLVAQLAWYGRVSLYANWPQTRPYLTELTQRLHVPAPIPRDITAFKINNAVIVEVSATPHIVQWSLELRNTADSPMQLPNIALTLTDVNEQAIARKVFTPAEYAPTPQTRTIDAQSVITIRRKLQIGVADSVGHIAEPFYP